MKRLDWCEREEENVCVKTRICGLGCSCVCARASSRRWFNLGLLLRVFGGGSGIRLKHLEKCSFLLVFTLKKQEATLKSVIVDVIKVIKTHFFFLGPEFVYF